MSSFTHVKVKRAIERGDLDIIQEIFKKFPDKINEKFYWVRALPAR
jgi:hypothetical protein